METKAASDDFKFTPSMYLLLDSPDPSVSLVKSSLNQSRSDGKELTPILYCTVLRAKKPEEVGHDVTWHQYDINNC